jgi:hypothetical protein
MRLDDPSEWESLKIVTSARPKMRIEEMRSFMPDGREPRLSPVRAQK